jgi:signal transduction histidine kinase
MKSWIKFRNWSIALIGFELFLLVFCLLYARQLLLEQILFFFLALFAALVLSDLLLTWTILLSFGLGIIFLVLGIVYIPSLQVFIFLFSFPVLIGILIKIRYYLFKMVSQVQDQEEEAALEYESMLSSKSEEIQTLLIHWSHEDLFFQIKPKEYNRMLSRIQDVISQSLMYNDKLFYISEGNFLVISDSNQHSLKEIYFNDLKEKLEELVFHGEDGNQGIQFQTGYLIVDSENREKNKHYSDLTSHLKRQLETDVIVEY